MRSSLLIAGPIALLVSSTVHAAGCPRAREQVDPFSGTKTVTMGTEFGVVLFDDAGIHFKYSTTAAGVSNVVVPKGFEWELLLADGRSLRVSTTTDALPVARASEYGVWTTWLLSYELDAEIVRALGSSQITATRSRPIYQLDSEQWSTITWKASKTKLMQVQFACAAATYLR